MNIKQIFHDAFYAVPDAGPPYLDISRVMVVLGGLAFIGQGVYALYRSGQWDPAHWGIGFAAVLGGGGWGIKKYNESPS